MRCRARDEDCEICSGSGLEPIFRCPHSIVTDESVAALELFAVFPKALARAGGFYDQTIPYLAAMRIIAEGRSRIEEIIRKAEERRAKQVRHG